MIENKSNVLMFSMFVMMGIFTLVVIFKGDFQTPPDANELAQVKKPIDKAFQELKSDQIRRKPATEVTQRPRKRPRHYAVVKRPEPIRMLLPIEKDADGRRVVVNQIVVLLAPQSSPSLAEHIGITYGLTLLYYDPSTGLAQFRIPAGNIYQRQDLQTIIPKQFKQVRAAVANALMTSSALPSEIKKNGLWYLKAEDNRTFDQGLFAIHYGGSTQTLPNVIVIPDTDIAWGRWTDRSHLWNQGYSCDFPNGNPIIAVVDSGNDPTHPEFLNRLDLTKSGNISCPNNSVSSFFDFDTHQACYQHSSDLLQLYTDLKAMNQQDRDESEIKMAHGLLVSGIIAADPYNGESSVGVCPQGKFMHIMTGKLQKDANTQRVGHFQTTIDGYLGVKEAVDRGAKIINASWHVEAPSQLCEGQYATDCVMLQMIRYARSKGAMIIAAAGNEARNIDVHPVSPGSMAGQWENPNNEFAHLVSVGAYNPKAERWYKSNYGAQNVSLFAPGELIASLKFSKDYVTNNAAQYGNVGQLDPRNVDATTGYLFDVDWTSGTSTSTPIVTAIAGIMYRILYDTFGPLNDPNPNRMYDYPKAITTLLHNTALRGGLCQVQVGQDVRSGCLDAPAAIDAAKNLQTLPILDVSTFPTGDLALAASQAAVTAASEEEDDKGGFGWGGGCGSISSGGPNGAAGNWPILILYFIPLMLIIRRRIILRHSRHTSSHLPA